MCTIKTNERTIDRTKNEETNKQTNKHDHNNLFISEITNRNVFYDNVPTGLHIYIQQKSGLYRV